MAGEVSFELVMKVICSWDKLKTLPNYKDAFGNGAISRFFEIAPVTKELFDYDETHPRMQMIARLMVDKIDTAVSFLGPDLDVLEAAFIELGRRHIHYRVKPQFFASMGIAVCGSLEELLGPRFGSDEKKAWVAVYNYMAAKMIQGLLSA